MTKLQQQIEAQRAKVAELAEKRKAAWDVSGWDNTTAETNCILGCWNFHHHFNNWRAAQLELQRLEAKLPKPSQEAAQP